MDKTNIAVHVFNKYADLYESRFMNVDLYADTLDYFCDNIITANAAILELACGPGNITRYLLKKRPDFKILATDLAPNMLQLAATNNPSAEFMLMDCRAISSMHTMYDGIMCGFCLPYLDREEVSQLIKDCAALLLPGALLYLSTMEDEYSKSGYRKASTGDEIFMHYYKAAFLMDLLTENDCKIIDCKRKVYPGADGATITDLIIIAKK